MPECPAPVSIHFAPSLTSCVLSDRALQVVLLVEYRGPTVILAFVLNGATGFLCILNHRTMDYFHSFCCKTMVKLPGHVKCLSIWDTGRLFTCDGIFNGSMTILLSVNR